MTQKSIAPVPTQSGLLPTDDHIEKTEKQLPTIKVSAPTLWVKRRPPVATKVLDTYWYFAAERQSIYRKRHCGLTNPWTEDQILRTYKFTNAFRAADRTSQYLIRNVIYSEQYSFSDTVFRILLFKFFNKIETWELISEHFGNVEIQSFNWQECDDLLNAAIKSKSRIYSAAYIMPSGPKIPGSNRKHSAHLRLLRQMMADDLPRKLEEATSMSEAYETLLAYPSIGPFLAYQFITDINYSEGIDFDEMEFVMPGPGARDGLSKCFSDFGDYTEADLIREVSETQDQAFSERDLVPCTLFGRRLQLIDCQNLFCEVDKYSRVAHPEIMGRTRRTRIKQKYRTNIQTPPPFYPPKWGINANAIAAMSDTGK